MSAGEEIEGLVSACRSRIRDAATWDLLFRHFNRSNGRLDRGYRKGEIIAIKLNCKADSKGEPWQQKGYPSPNVVYAMVRQLIEVAGIPGSCIALSDPSRYINQILYDKVCSNSKPDYRQVSFVGKEGGTAPQRIKAEPDRNCPVYFASPGNESTVMYPPKTYTGAAYLINCALVRPHLAFGITMAAKNFFGSACDDDKKVFIPGVLHAYALWDHPTPYRHGEHNGLMQPRRFARIFTSFGHAPDGIAMPWIAGFFFPSPSQGVILNDRGKEILLSILQFPILNLCLPRKTMSPAAV